jgi:hypothetical protein
VPITPRQDTVQIDGPSATPVQDSGGIGGLFAGAEPLRSAPEPPSRPATAVFAAAPAPVPPPPPVPPPTDRHVQSGSPEEVERGGRRRRTALLAVVTVVLAAAIGALAWSLMRGPSDGPGTDAGPSATTSTAPAGPEVGSVQQVAGVAFTVQAVQVDDTCVGHSYGQTADFFATTNCTGVSRALYSAELPGGPVVVSVSRVQMADPATARELQALTDRNGSGNISDLLREGVRYTGSPSELSDAEYASALNGETVTIVESAWVDPDATTGTDADIDAVATNGLALETEDIPAD